jgi:hypothetical protein
VMAVLYRIIQYEGPQEWIDKTLNRSIHGEQQCGPTGVIRAATIDPEDELSVTLCRDKLRNMVAQLESSRPKGFV